MMLRRYLVVERYDGRLKGVVGPNTGFFTRWGARRRARRERLRLDRLYLVALDPNLANRFSYDVVVRTR